MKLTTLLFGLLLAVGWTSSAFAQGTAQVSRVVKNKAYYQQFTYSWTDEDTGETHYNVDPTEPATNPYQIYELISFVYGNPNFPGPTYNAYLPNYTREDKVTYEPITRGGWNITQGSGTYQQGQVIAPHEDGYTVLVVALNNDIQKVNENGNYNSSYFTTKAQLISYFRNNIEFVKLLTDGLRVGSEDDHTSGTIFNCDGRYNKFFFLSKGQARKKAPYVTNYISANTNNRWYMGEDVPFRSMFEQLSPTSTALSDDSQTPDFFSKMMEGNVYGLKHDCPSVIQTGHQFSLTGNTGTEYFSFSGLNLFIPDYRLLWWNGTGTDTSYPYQLVDGRDSDPYQSSNATTGAHGSNYRTPSANNYYMWSAWYANYNPTYAPKIGIYKITLQATAEFVGDPENPNHQPGNQNYLVTLHWVSSLDQMSGHPVTQIYTIYYFDRVTGERKKLVVEGVTNPTGETTISYLVDQEEHSYVIEYIVHGTPNDDEHPAFQAWSNRDGVVIPGWNDFVGLQLDHHESDFVITPHEQNEERHNWYRNFVAIVNESVTNGLSVSNISGYDDSPVMNEFNLYRFLYNDNNEPIMPGTKIATVKFDQASAEKVHYKVTYEDGQQILADKYQRSAMEVPDEGWVRVKGNGDLVIWPNSYHVNIKSITIKNGNSPVATWSAENSNANTGNTGMPSTWQCSPGSKVIPFITEANDKVCYIEGGGYLYIPNMLPNDNLKVEIVAYSESAGRITVNDHFQMVDNTAKTYVWGGTGQDDIPISPNAAPRRADRETITYYQKVTSAADFTSGDEYLIVNEAASQAMNGSLTRFGDSGTNAFSVNISDGRIESNETTDARTFTITGSGSSYTVKSASGYYIGRVSGSSGGAVTQSQTTAYDHTIYLDTSNSDGRFFFRCDEGYSYWYYLRFNSGSAQFRYYTSQSQQPIYLYKKVTEEVGPTEGGQLRLHLLMVDQLKAAIPDDNSHPDAYGYVLKWEQPENATDHKQSGTVKVNIQKTDCEVMSYYTLNEIDADKNIGRLDENGNIVHDQGLTMDVITADVEFDLSDSNDLLRYYNLQARENQPPTPNEYLVTKLFRQEDFSYREMLEGSPHLGEEYQSGEHHYFDDSTPIKTGFYDNGNRFMSYAPSVSTWGIQRRYYEDDHLDNTYGGPIWKTAVGKAQMGLNPDDPDDQEYKPIVEFQEGWNTSWTVNGQGSNLYMLDNINAIGYLPLKSLTKVEFEPYMFRVFVESDNGKLRPFKYVKDDKGNDVITADENGSTTGPTCVWSGYIKRDNSGKIINDPENGVIVDSIGTYGPYTYTKNKVNRANPDDTWTLDENNAIFGALDDLLEITGYDAQGNPIYKDIPEKDLRIFVRFYFNVKGEAAGHTPLTRAEGSRSGNGAESGGSAAGGVATSVKELQYHGEVVSTTYYNVQGMVSDKPFDGVNIVVTRYSDGASSISKVVR